MISLLIYLLIGALVGYLAGKITKSSSNSILIDCLIGIAGSVVGGWLFGILGLGPTGSIGSFIASLVGAVIVIYIINAIKKK